jgi:EAL domain-containing protein (putative c-di-GMP-specific phosphodiesterase class I)/GGDEF domain-containing protein
MSLIRQIWLLLLGTLLLAFAGGVAITVGSARDTLQTQLALKNTDNANSLALVLSQQKGDPELMGLILSSQFDTGYYRRIRLLGADAKVLLLREVGAEPRHAPGWFVAILPIDAPPGVAQVSDGWRALGSVEVISHTSFAHDDLWLGSLRSAGALLVLGLLAALLARSVIRRIQRPLDDTVDQAQKLVAGEFVSMPEPAAPELRRVTRAMNSMVARLKLIFEAQARQLEALRQQATCDALTGLANRKQFMAQLSASLEREDAPTHGGLVLLRVMDLSGVNRQIGHEATDRMIVAVANALQIYSEQVKGCHLGRLNGSDFGLCLPVGGVSFETASALASALSLLLPSFGTGMGVAVGAVETQRLRPLAQVMSGADAALARAEARGAFAVELGVEPAVGVTLLGAEAWRQQLDDALQIGRVRLARYPLINVAQELVHLECPLRLQLEIDGPFEAAARWLPLALRSRMTAAVDERAVSLALADIALDGMSRCVNLSAASLADSGFAARLRALLLTLPRPSRQLWLEVPEAAAVEHFALVQELGRQLRPTGARFGLEHAGPQLGRIDRLFEAGLDYAKLDASVTQHVAGDADRSNFVRSMVVMLHGLAVQVFAEGVADAADARVLWQCGVDGITGPWASAQRGDLLG